MGVHPSSVTSQQTLGDFSPNAPHATYHASSIKQWPCNQPTNQPTATLPIELSSLFPSAFRPNLPFHHSFAHPGHVQLLGKILVR